MDQHGFLYVSDCQKNEVKRWKMGDYNNEGIIVAGGNGIGDQLNQLNESTFLFVDEDQSVYVSDSNNHRVMKWKKGAKEGTIVVGGNKKGRNLNQLSSAQGIIVDDLGQIYVADWGNNRVMRWCEGQEEGEIVVGGNGQENQLNGLVGLSFDDKGNLYDSDMETHQIQKFEIQTINEQKQNSQNFPLIEQINQWEIESIDKIQQKAQEYREIVIKSSQTCFNDIDMKLKDLNEQIKQMQIENEFNETGLNYLRNQLIEIKEQLNNPSDISIKKDSQSIINEISIISSKKSTFNKWKQNAITVAGENENGEGLNQLNRPQGIFIDKNKTIFIADTENHRIVEWNYNAKEGQIIAGGNGRGKRINQLNYPAGVIVDEQNHSIIIADYMNRRVIQWLNQNQQILIDNIDCYGLAIHKNGFLYVSDEKKNEVRRWKMGEYNNEGIIVAGGNGIGNQPNQLNKPGFIFVDENQSVYISDTSNHSVMKWIKGAKEGIIVAGGNGQGRNLNQLFSPQEIIVDDLGQIYVADWGNNRVMRWCEGQEEGEIVVGGNGQENQLNGLVGLSFDDKGNLYVSDMENHRIVKFEIIS
ncbi:unnamed protein product [Adineta steineri]|uniref:NHL repeat containing protein n=1 Tax=Adineta steineri TaxID=433720 RepID=A0A814S964_9BILA|nr:unnamed protein product [Adineta steineri]